jgi:hypothetical protein
MRAAMRAAKDRTRNWLAVAVSSGHDGPVRGVVFVGELSVQQSLGLSAALVVLDDERT